MKLQEYNKHLKNGTTGQEEIATNTLIEYCKETAYIGISKLCADDKREYRMSKRELANRGVNF